MSRRGSANSEGNGHDCMISPMKRVPFDHGDVRSKFLPENERIVCEKIPLRTLGSYDVNGSEPSLGNSFQSQVIDICVCVFVCVSVCLPICLTVFLSVSQPVCALLLCVRMFVFVYGWVCISSPSLLSPFFYFPLAFVLLCCVFCVVVLWCFLFYFVFVLLLFLFTFVLGFLWLFLFCSHLILYHPLPLVLLSDSLI